VLGASAQGHDLVLASASPRRAELLASAGFTFTVVPAEVDETPRPDEAPEPYVRRVAEAKARTVAETRRGNGRIVLAADTTVVVGGEMFGKPQDRGDAARMLHLLSGTVHEVLTGVVVVAGDHEESQTVRTRVRFLPLSSAEIAWYVESGEPDGKAGAYAIQGRAARFIDWIDGSWSNVVGLPVATVYLMLKKASP
jgi:septum formation protein